MDRTTADPFAAHMLAAYGDTAAHSRQFRDQYGIPPTIGVNSQYFRAVVQAFVVGDDRYQLEPRYTEFGGVQCVDLETGVEFVLRSAAALAIEIDKRSNTTDPLFSVDTLRVPSTVSLLVYQFARDGLRLDIAPAFQHNGRGRYELGGDLAQIGTWSFSEGDAEPFDQGYADRFAEVGAVDIDAEASGK